MELDGYSDAGLLVAVALVNGLTPGHDRGRPVGPAADASVVLREALAIDPPSVAALAPRHVRGFESLAVRLRDVFAALDAEDVASAAATLNALLAAHPASPHLAYEDGRWRLHHHTAAAPLVAMWTSITAEAMARLIGAGEEARLGICSAEACDRVFVDASRNGSRRFCCTTCQNRVKTATFRRRRAGAA